VSCCVAEPSHLVGTVGTICRFWLGRICLLVLVGILTGCGSSAADAPSGSVSIQITFQGKPVTAGSVQLVASNGGAGAFGELDPMGKITFHQIAAGSYKVVVLPPAPPDPDPEKPSPPPQKYPNIPQQVRSELTSPLVAEVKPDDNNFIYDLNSPTTPGTP